uniref:Fatty acyl-CoA reductase n=1 Tax=Anopheles epiroticus TaxID=199890 RepID=A0A182P1X8_9DIPT
IFDKIRESVVHPNKLFKKLQAVETDFTSEEFVKEPYKKDLLNETQIVFHVMGSVRFDMDFQSIMDTNVTSAERLYTFLRRAPDLQVIIHVSTFYSNCDRLHFEECVYDDIRYGGWENIRRILEPLNESEKAKLRPTFISPLPNNYMFSKRCAEVMIQKRYSDLPIGIFRPPVVTPSYQEPVPGWVDRIQGLTGLCIPILKHQLVRYYGEPTTRPPVTPVDYCIAALITAACDVKEQLEQRVATLPVYNFYFDKHLITFQQFFGLVGANLPTATGRMLSTVRTRLTRWRVLSMITFWWMYFLAYIADLLLAIAGKPKWAVAGLKALADQSEFFRCHTWTARNDNVKRMRQLLSKADEALLEFDVDRIELKDYYKYFTAGLSFPVKKIVLLVREKRGVSVPERLREMISDPIFDKIRESVVHPNKLFEKLQAVETDFTSEEFVKEPYKTDLLNETQIVFHVMASVRFDLRFQSIMETNVTSPERLYTLLRQAPDLQAIVHVSTLYSNCDRSHIEECVYDDIRYGGWENIRQILEPLTESETAKLVPMIVGPLPNNYVFSKKCAEVMIQKRFSDLPIGIFRPPVVTPSYQEPFPGWVDCIQGVTGVCIPILKQKLLWYYGDPSSSPALTPVDYCIAAMITAACDVRERQEEKRVKEQQERRVESPPVYNFYFDKNIISWQQFIALVGAGLPTATGRMLWLNRFICSNVSAVEGTKKLIDVTEYFRCNTWTARNDNVKRMRESLSKADEVLLKFDVDRIDLVECYQRFTVGLMALLERKKLRRFQKKKLEC